ncbi:MAG: Acetyltransferase domain [Gammaproteobacteria bacterium]|jgi:predicted GNAT family N-acyltransferase|nr:Acetyltransferase domain [Gammaproteobacteria bacterium]
MSDFYYSYAKELQGINDFYQLVKDVYVDEKGYSIDIPDLYAEGAKHYIIKDQGKVVAGFRINEGERKHDFPSGDTEQLILNPGHRYAEISRWAIHPEHRKKVSIVKTFRDFALYSQENAISHFIAKVTLDLIGFYERYGLYKIGNAFYDPKPFAKLISPEDKAPNFQLMLLPAKELCQRYLL